MNVVRWDPTRELSLLQGDVNRLFGRFLDGAPGSTPDQWLPPMDVAEEAEHFVITMDVPGVSRDDLVIEVHERTLRVSGERRQERSDEHASYFRMERGYGSFARTMTLPKGIDADAIEASVELGVLELRVPKPAEVKPRRIEIGESRPKQVEVESASSGRARRSIKDKVLANS